EPRIGGRASEAGAARPRLRQRAAPECCALAGPAASCLCTGWRARAWLRRSFRHTQADAFAAASAMARARRGNRVGLAEAPSPALVARRAAMGVVMYRRAEHNARASLRSRIRGRAARHTGREARRL